MAARQDSVSRACRPVGTTTASYPHLLLADAGIESVVLDVYTSVMEGSISAIPRRLAVTEADFDRALRVLEDAGEETSL